MGVLRPGDITTHASDHEGALVSGASQPPTDDNVNTATLATLAQPYPRVVSDPPGSWSFDDGVFKFSYSTPAV